MEKMINVLDQKSGLIRRLSPRVWAEIKKSKPHFVEISEAKMPDEIQVHLDKTKMNSKLIEFIAPVEVPAEMKTIDELKAEAKMKDIKGFGRMTKETLLQKLGYENSK